MSGTNAVAGAAPTNGANAIATEGALPPVEEHDDTSQTQAIMHPAKRRREGDDDAAEYFEDDASTELQSQNHEPCAFTSDMQENEDEGESFQVVTRKKNRKSGIPVYFKVTGQNNSFWKVNPNLIAREIIRETQEKVLSHRITREGNLVIVVGSEVSANSLLLMKSLAGIDVEVYIPSSYLQTMGRITDVPRWYTQEQLLEYLGPCGVIGVKREVVFSREADGSSVPHTKKSVILTFRPGDQLPRDVTLGFTCHPV